MQPISVRTGNYTLGAQYRSEPFPVAKHRQRVFKFFLRKPFARFNTPACKYLIRVVMSVFVMMFVSVVTALAVLVMVFMPVVTALSVLVVMPVFVMTALSVLDRKSVV